MKPRIILSFLFLFLLPLSLGLAQTRDVSAYGYFLKTCVKDGLVNYSCAKDKQDSLDSFLSSNAKEMLELDQKGREERLAFWINFYNAMVIHSILQHPSMTKVSEIPDLYTQAVMEIGNVKLSLSDLEVKIWTEFKDERVIAALVSGIMQSPKLKRDPFTAERLDEDLNSAASAFVDDSSKNKIDMKKKRVFLSPLFKDRAYSFLFNFGKPPENKKEKFSNEERAILSFVMYHSKDARKRLFLDNNSFKLKYLDTDLRLNAASHQPQKKY